LKVYQDLKLPDVDSVLCVTHNALGNEQMGFSMNTIPVFMDYTHKEILIKM
jgi:hypothetical protein